MSKPDTTVGPNAAQPVSDLITWGDFSLRQLAYFIAVAEEGTISGAAERLYMSQSAVSASITELERLLGADLCVRRRAQGVTLTPVGHEVLEHARQLLGNAAELNYLARGQDDELVGPLVVGCFLTLAPTILPPLLEELQRRHPKISVDFVEGNQIRLQEALARGELDIAVMYDLDLQGALNSIELYAPHAYALFGRHSPFAAKQSVTLEELESEPLALFDQPPSAQYGLSVFTARGLTPNVRYRTHSYELTRSLVARNLAYALLVTRPPSTASFEGREIVEREIVPNVAKVPVLLAWPRDARLSPRARALAELAQEMYSSLGQ